MEFLRLDNFNIKNPLIIICGPTASGKTDLSYQFYSLIDSEIISADSRQIFRHLDIGTAKPEKTELTKYNYHLIDFLDLNQKFSAGDFVNQANNIILDIYKKNKIPLIVGGTGFYISSLCDGIMKDNFENHDNVFDAKSFEKIRNLSREDLYIELEKIDMESATLYRDKNPHRLIRALEFYYKTGEKISEARKYKTAIPNFTPIYFAIDHSREILYNRINYRCEKMIENGLLKEISKILEMGYSRDLHSLNTVGYKEFIKYLNNETTFDYALNEFKKNTRRYAKRQLTWFRKNKEIIWLNPNSDIKFQLINHLKPYILE